MAVVNWQHTSPPLARWPSTRKAYGQPCAPDTARVWQYLAVQPPWRSSGGQVRQLHAAPVVWWRDRCSYAAIAREGNAVHGAGATGLIVGQEPLQCEHYEPPGYVVMTARGHEIMVGYDGSAGSAEVLDWAVREARLRRLPLTVCAAWMPVCTAAGADGGDKALPVEQAGAVDPAREHAEAVLARGVRRVQACDSAVEARPQLVCGPPSRALCEQCAGTDMLVVGSRGLGGFAGLLLGSAGLQVAAQAPVPVTVVRGHWRPVPVHNPPRVVVGSDGSPRSHAALELAVEEAALRDVPLVAVCALSDAAGVVGTARKIEADDFSTAMAKLQADHPEVLGAATGGTGCPSLGAPGSRVARSAARGRRARARRPARDDPWLGQPRRPAPCALPGDIRARRLIRSGVEADQVDAAADFLGWSVNSHRAGDARDRCIRHRVILGASLGALSSWRARFVVIGLSSCDGRRSRRTERGPEDVRCAG